MRRCRHEWLEVKRYYVRRMASAKGEGMTEEMLRDLAFGFTVVELRCAHCGDIESRSLPGDAT